MSTGTVAHQDGPAVGGELGRALRVLVVDDEASMRDMLRIVLRRDGYDVLVAENGRAALGLLGREPVDLLLSDIRMPDLSGVDVLRAAKDANRDVIAFMMTAFASTETAVEAMRLGAVDYFTKPVSMDELRMKVRQHLEAHRLKQENVLLKRALDSSHQFSNIIGRSEPMLAVFKMIETIARTNSTVLITGESGTGKDLVARAVHYNSMRRDQPFVALNCGAVPETLLESELFGHMRGAFTGADQNKKGLLEAAERGTIFLDEIGEMNASMQVKLLRVLQERRFRPLGGTDEVRADVRVIAATNQELPRLVAEGRFREDLFYRINVIPIHLPPLRERREDIPVLARHFLDKFAPGAQMQVSQSAMRVLMAYSWPGNIRQLENALERAVALSAGRAQIEVTDLPPEAQQGGDGEPGFPPILFPEEGVDFERFIADIEREMIRRSLERTHGNKGAAARLLNLKRTTLVEKLKRMGPD